MLLQRSSLGRLSRSLTRSCASSMAHKPTVSLSSVAHKPTVSLSSSMTYKPTVALSSSMTYKPTVALSSSLLARADGILIHTSQRSLSSNKSASLELVKKLREITHAPLVDCKAAIAQVFADTVPEEVGMQQAIDFLRKKGVLTAAKKASRSTAEGLIGMVLPHTGSQHAGVLVELNCETDFVARNEKFKNMVLTIGRFAYKQPNVGNIVVPDLLKSSISTQKDGGKNSTLGEELTQLVVATGENVKLTRAFKLQLVPKADTVSAIAGYVHGSEDSPVDGAHVGRIGVLVALESNKDHSERELVELGEQLAMHVTIANPQYVNREQVPQEVIEKEREIIIEQSKQTGKPQNALDKVIQGKLNKFFEETVLLDQVYAVGDAGKASKIKDLLASKGKSIKVTAFRKYRVGEHDS